MLPAFHPLLFAMQRPKDTGNYSILSSSLTHRHTINNPVMPSEAPGFWTTLHRKGEARSSTRQQKE